MIRQRLDAVISLLSENFNFCHKQLVKEFTAHVQIMEFFILFDTRLSVASAIAIAPRDLILLRCPIQATPYLPHYFYYNTFKNE